MISYEKSLDYVEAIFKKFSIKDFLKSYENTVRYAITHNNVATRGQKLLLHMPLPTHHGLT